MVAEVVGAGDGEMGWEGGAGGEGGHWCEGIAMVVGGVCVGEGRGVDK